MVSDTLGANGKAVLAGVLKRIRDFVGSTVKIAPDPEGTPVAAGLEDPYLQRVTEPRA
jgi:hypothetical protein